MKRPPYLSCTNANELVDGFNCAPGGEHTAKVRFEGVWSCSDAARRHFQSPGFTVGKHYRKVGWRASDTHELAFDDVQWLDAASAELLHYVARMSRARPLLVALSARAGELPDNEAVQRMLRSLREMGLVDENRQVPFSHSRLHLSCRTAGRSARRRINGGSAARVISSRP